MFRLRAQQIIIDIPKADSEPWVNIYVQRVRIEEDGSESRVIDRWGSINKRLSTIAFEIYPYFEAVPVTNPEKEISAYGLSDAIMQAAIHWIAEKYSGRIEGNAVYID